MEQRIIRLSIKNDYILGSGVEIGAVGSHDEVVMRMDFTESPMWAGLSKRAIFTDALGQNQTPILLMDSLLAEGQTDVYMVPVPQEAKMVEGNAFLTIEGYIIDNSGKETVKAVTEEATFPVLPSKNYLPESADVTPDQAQQLQAEIDSHIADQNNPHGVTAEKIGALTKVPAATADNFGGIKADPKTSDQTEPAGIGSDGKLYVKPGNGSASGVPYFGRAVCDTAADDSAKTVVCDSDCTGHSQVGSIIAVKFTHGNTATRNPVLGVFSPGNTEDSFFAAFVKDAEGKAQMPAVPAGGYVVFQYLESGDCMVLTSDFKKAGSDSLGGIKLSGLGPQRDQIDDTAVRTNTDGTLFVEPPAISHGTPCSTPKQYRDLITTISPAGLRICEISTTSNIDATTELGAGRCFLYTLAVNAAIDGQGAHITQIAVNGANNKVIIRKALNDTDWDIWEAVSGSSDTKFFEVTNNVTTYEQVQEALNAGKIPVLINSTGYIGILVDRYNSKFVFRIDSEDPTKSTLVTLTPEGWQFPPVNTTLPTATADALGGIKAGPATAEDTQAVHIKPDGTLATKPGSGGGGGSIAPALICSDLAFETDKTATAIDGSTVDAPALGDVFTVYMKKGNSAKANMNLTIGGVTAYVRRNPVSSTEEYKDSNAVFVGSIPPKYTILIRLAKSHKEDSEERVWEWLNAPGSNPLEIDLNTIGFTNPTNVIEYGGSINCLVNFYVETVYLDDLLNNGKNENGVYIRISSSINFELYTKYRYTPESGGINHIFIGRYKEHLYELMIHTAPSEATSAVFKRLDSGSGAAIDDNNVSPNTTYSSNKIVQLSATKADLGPDGKVVPGQLPPNQGGDPEKGGRFAGVKANFLGDSQTGAAGNYKSKFYFDWLKEILNLSDVRNYGVSGSPIKTDFLDRYDTMEDDADLIVVWGGTNDYQYKVPIGTIKDHNRETFYGCLNLLCEGLLRKYPFRQIVFITPTQRNPLPESSVLAPLSAYVDAIIDVCQYYGIPVYDAFRRCPIPVRGDFNRAYTIDGLHLNDLGHEILGKSFSNWLLYSSAAGIRSKWGYTGSISVSLNTSAVAVPVGGKTTLMASVVPDNTGITPRWSVNKGGILNIPIAGNSAEVSGVKDGTATVTVHIGNIASATCEVTVGSGGTVVPVSGVTLNTPTAKLAVGEIVKLKATVQPPDATDQSVVWSANNGNCTVQQDGTVKAISEGQSIITVRTNDGGREATCAVNVTAAVIPVTSVKLSSNRETLNVGDSVTLTADVQPPDATNRTVEWKAGNEKCSVSGGVVVAKAAGDCTITATAGGKSDTCEITVNRAQVPASPVDGKTIGFTAAARYPAGKNILTLLIDSSMINNYPLNTPIIATLEAETFSSVITVPDASSGMAGFQDNTGEVNNDKFLTPSPTDYAFMSKSGNTIISRNTRTAASITNPYVKIPLVFATDVYPYTIKIKTLTLEAEGKYIPILKVGGFYGNEGYMVT